MRGVVGFTVGAASLSKSGKVGLGGCGWGRGKGRRDPRPKIRDTCKNFVSVTGTRRSVAAAAAAAASRPWGRPQRSPHAVCGCQKHVASGTGGAHQRKHTHGCNQKKNKIWGSPCRPGLRWGLFPCDGQFIDPLLHRRHKLHHTELPPSRFLSRCQRVHKIKCVFPRRPHLDLTRPS